MTRITLTLLAAALSTGGCTTHDTKDGTRPKEHAQSADEKIASGKTAAINAGDQKLLAYNMLDASVKTPIALESTAFQNNAPIPTPYSAYGEDFSPPLKWSNIPAGTQSIVVLLEDPDAAKPKPFVHWILYNLTADTRELHASIPTQARLTELGQPDQGRNSRGSIGYFGPKPPVGDPPHHYHFTIFALDTKINGLPGIDQAKLKESIKGHILAKGLLVGTFEKPAK